MIIHTNLSRLQNFVRTPLSWRSRASFLYCGMVKNVFHVGSLQCMLTRVFFFQRTVGLQETAHRRDKDKHGKLLIWPSLSKTGALHHKNKLYEIFQARFVVWPSHAWTKESSQLLWRGCNNWAGDQATKTKLMLAVQTRRHYIFT